MFLEQRDRLWKSLPVEEQTDTRLLDIGMDLRIDEPIEDSLNRRFLVIDGMHRCSGMQELHQEWIDRHVDEKDPDSPTEEQSPYFVMQRCMVFDKKKLGRTMAFQAKSVNENTNFFVEELYIDQIDAYRANYKIYMELPEEERPGGDGVSAFAQWYVDNISAVRAKDSIRPAVTVALGYPEEVMSVVRKYFIDAEVPPLTPFYHVDMVILKQCFWS